ncbi:MAG: DUF6261 family protein [Prevotellaceae bacterium]|jgi:hypothetical protein|nr:DUF6261 family protein [Prevotellaceae bacterium]
MAKFIALRVSPLRLDDIAGLVTETVTISVPHIAALGEVGEAKLNALITASDLFLSLLNKQRASELTPQILEKDKLRDALFSEIKRAAKTAQKSSIAEMAAAGTKLIDFFHPFWTIDKEPLMSQTTQISLIARRYADDQALIDAATLVGLTVQIANLFATNTALLALYNTRLEELGVNEGPSASSVKKQVIAAYEEFCRTFELTLSALPTDELQVLFNELNDIRRKYISRLPTPLNSVYTSVAPIAEQHYTGRHLTPLPRVFYQSGDMLRELAFSVDFTVTYRNNINIGEAKLSVHGKGKYIGRYDTTFHIVE